MHAFLTTWQVNGLCLRVAVRQGIAALHGWCANQGSVSCNSRRKTEWHAEDEAYLVQAGLVCGRTINGANRAALSISIDATT
jgi:hypothetical protein